MRPRRGSADDWRSTSNAGVFVAETAGGDVVALCGLEASDPSSSVTVYFPIAPEERPALRDPWTAYAVRARGGDRR